MAKPIEGLPQWNENETNIIDPPTTYKDDGWGLTEKPPSQYFNWFMNLAYKWISWIDGILGGNRIVIDSQVKFDAYFDGVGTKTGNIYLAEVGIAYQHNNNIIFGSNFKLDGDNGVLIEKASATARFEQTGTPDNVHLTDNIIYDGKKATYTFTGNGGFASITGCTNSRFEINVKDCKSSVNGGAYASAVATNENCVIKNISGCEAVGDGGGVYCVYNSSISNINGCIAGDDGGGVFTCGNCNFTNIYDNTAVGRGGGLSHCDDSFFSGWFGGNSDSGAGATIYLSTGLAFMLTGSGGSVVQATYGSISG